MYLLPDPEKVIFWGHLISIISCFPFPFYFWLLLPDSMETFHRIWCSEFINYSFVKPTVRACVHAQLLSYVWLFVTPWTVTHQAPLSMEFSTFKTLTGPRLHEESVWIIANAATTSPLGSCPPHSYLICYGIVLPACCCSVAQSCLTLHDPMGCCTPSFPVLHHFPELAQTRVQNQGDGVKGFGFKLGSATQ